MWVDIASRRVMNIVAISRQKEVRRHDFALYISHEGFI